MNIAQKCLVPLVDPGTDATTTSHYGGLRQHEILAVTLWRMNVANTRMRERTADESDVLQPGEPDVGDELAAPAHQAIVLFTRQPRADALGRTGV